LTIEMDPGHQVKTMEASGFQMMGVGVVAAEAIEMEAGVGVTVVEMMRNVAITETEARTRRIDIVKTRIAAIDGMTSSGRVKIGPTTTRKQAAIGRRITGIEVTKMKGTVGKIGAVRGVETRTENVTEMEKGSAAISANQIDTIVTTTATIDVARAITIPLLIVDANLALIAPRTTNLRRRS